MRMRVLFVLVLLAALPVVVNAQTPDCHSGTVPATYISGTVIGGPTYAATPMSSPGYTVVERTGPFGLMRWRTVEPIPTVMPQPVMTATTGTTTVMPAVATTTTPMMTPMTGQSYTFVERSGPLGLMRWRTLEPTPTAMTAPVMMAPTPTAVTPALATTTPMPAMTGAVVASPSYTVVERSGPLGFFRWRTMEPTTTVMPAPPIPPAPTGITPAAATTPIQGAATTSNGVITGGYVVPSASTTTVTPATYTYRTGLFGRRYYVTPMSMDSTVMPATYTAPSTTYYYPQSNTGRYYGFGGFGFWTR